jgi:putative cell wall-binding protein
MGATTLAATPALAAGQTVVSLTFDDANADQMPAAATLASKGLPGTFFVNSGFLNQPGYMSTADLATLSSQGHEIGGHTRSHPDLVTVPADEAARQICNDRVALTALGYPVTSFAYPFASSDAAVEATVAACGYNSARGLGDLRTAPGTPCADCAFAESIPPADPFWTRAADQVDASWTLAQLQSTVTDAVPDGGWVQLTFHHVCDGCDNLALSPAVFDQFTTWLAGWADGVNTVVKTVGGVVGGAVKPTVSGPAFVPPPAAAPGVNALQNPGFEEIAAAGIPRCWWDSVFGINTAEFSTVTPGRTGTNASHVTVSGYTSGDAKRLQIFDGGACAPTVVSGQSYSLRAWYKSSGLTQFTVYYRITDGSWIYGTSSDWFAAASDYSPAVWTTPPMPANVNGISFALNVFSNGELTVDDYAMYNTVGAPLLELAAPAPTITGVAQFNTALTAVAGNWGPAPVALSYQWSVANVPVSGATASSYTPVAADVGKTVTVTVSGTKAGYAPVSKTSVPTAAVAARTLSSATPTVTGTPRLGAVLTANTGVWGPSPVSFSYQWSANGQALAGATNAKYTLTAADVGKSIVVAVTGSKPGYASVTLSSAGSGVGTGTLTTATPSVTGSARVGAPLTATTGAWGPSPVSFSYQWMVAGQPVSGAITARFTPRVADLGKSVSVAVTGTKTGYSAATTTSAASPAVQPGAMTTATPTITGSAVVGSVLTAVAAAWGPQPVALSYQWLVNDVAVSGATAPIFTPQGRDAGHSVSVRVTGTKSGYATTSSVSARTGPVAAQPSARIGGADRYATSALVSAAAFAPGVPVVYIATGTQFPDALSGGAAAGHNKGPVLLVTADGIPAPIHNELLRLKPTRIVVLGGAGAVSDRVANALKRIAPTTRIGGADRYETSARISAATFKSGVPAVYVTTGENFPDALSGGAAAGATGAPVLLVTRDRVPAAIRAEIARLKPQKIIVLGGTGVVSGSVATALTSIAPTSRIAGDDRYGTSAKISRSAFSPGVPIVYLATGVDFPDALSGSAAAIAGAGPVLLVTEKTIPAAVRAELARLRPHRVVVLGGPTRVGNAVLKEAQGFVR